VIDCSGKKRGTHCVLLPHNTPELQRLGFSFMLPLKTYHAQWIEIWLKIHPNRVVTHYKITELFGRAYLKSATAAIPADGIRKTGLFPWNRHIHVIDGHDFLEVLRWAAFVMRMEVTRTTRKITEWTPYKTRPVGRPRLRWMD